MISNIPSLATSVSWAPSSAIIERLQSIEKNIFNMIKKIYFLHTVESLTFWCPTFVDFVGTLYKRIYIVGQKIDIFIYVYVLIEREREGEREKKELPEVLDVLFLPTMKACSFLLRNDI